MGKMGRKRKKRSEGSGLGYCAMERGECGLVAGCSPGGGASMSPCPDFFLMYNIVGRERYQSFHLPLV